MSMNEQRVEDASEPSDQWGVPAARIPLRLREPVYGFHDRIKPVKSAAATAEFTEMLCQIDPRMDRSIPSCYLLHPYIFALLDALRAEYVFCYLPVRTKVGWQPPPCSYAQFKFWQDEDNAYNLIKEWCSNAGIDPLKPCDPAHHREDRAQYTQATSKRRAFTMEYGLTPTQYYPWQLSDVAAADQIEQQGEFDDFYAPDNAGPCTAGSEGPETSTGGNESDDAAISAEASGESPARFDKLAF